MQGEARYLYVLPVDDCGGYDLALGDDHVLASLHRLGGHVGDLGPVQSHPALRP